MDGVPVVEGLKFSMAQKKVKKSELTVLETFFIIENSGAKTNYRREYFYHLVRISNILTEIFIFS